MIYTKMMDSLNEEETPQEEQVVSQEQPAEIEEISVDDIESLNAYDKEHVELSTEITLKSMEFDKKFSMMSHVAKFGVDRSFLSICNSNNELATELGITLPATEDFEIYGDPNSNVSKKVISSMEAFLDFGKKESLWSKFWKWIKEIVGKILNWIKGFFTKVWEFIKNLLGLGKAKLDKIEEVATQLKKAGIKTVDVNDDFARLGQDLQRGFIERQDRLIRSRQRVATIKEIANTSLKIIKDLVKTRGEWVPARVQELEATTGKLKDWTANTWGAVKGVTGAVSDTVGRARDFLYDVSHSNADSARRYAQKTVVEQRRREYINASRHNHDPLDDWMAHTYTVQGGTGRHTTNTVFDNTDPWSYRNNGPQSSGQQQSGRQQPQPPRPQPPRPQPPQPPQPPRPQPQPQPQPMSIEELIRNHVADIRDGVLRSGGEGEQYNDLVMEMTDILNDLNAMQRQVSNNNTTTEHASVVQENVQELINAVNNILDELRRHHGEQGAALVNANRIAEDQLVNLVHGFQNQISLLGVVIFDSVNDSHDTFTVTSSEIRNVDYRRFVTNLHTPNNNQGIRIDGEWVRPEGTDNDGCPDTWGVYIPSYINVSAIPNHPNQLSAVLTCALPRRSIADIWRGYGQSVRHASYWGAVRSNVTINVRFCVSLDSTEFANAIDNAYANNSPNATFNFESLIPARQSTNIYSPATNTHTITIGGNVLSDLYTRIRTAIRRNQASAQDYPHLAAHP